MRHIQLWLGLLVHTVHWQRQQRSVLSPGWAIISSNLKPFERPLPCLPLESISMFLSALLRVMFSSTRVVGASRLLYLAKGLLGQKTSADGCGSEIMGKDCPSQGGRVSNGQIRSRTFPFCDSRQSPIFRTCSLCNLHKDVTDTADGPKGYLKALATKTQTGS